MATQALSVLSDAHAPCMISFGEGGINSRLVLSSTNEKKKSQDVFVFCDSIHDSIYASLAWCAHSFEQ
jgi:hypothetical protein